MEMGEEDERGGDARKMKEVEMARKMKEVEMVRKIDREVF